MKVFVTGGSGFVGHCMIQMLRERGYQVKALARSEQAAKRVSHLGADVVRGDLLDQAVMTDGMRDCKIVVHVAGLLSTWGSYETFYQANVVGTQRTLAAAKTAKVEKFVQVGASASVMNHKPLGHADENFPLQQPTFSPYIATKSLAEQQVVAANQPGFMTAVVRPAWIWGTGDRAIPQLAQAVRAGQFIWIDRGNYTYTTTHVANVCHGAILAAERSSGGQAYFLADDNLVQFREWVTTLLQIEGVTPENRSIPYRLAWKLARIAETFWQVTRRQDTPPLTRTMVRLIGQEFILSDRKARSELGYTPIVSRVSGLAELVRSRDQILSTFS